MDEAFFFDSYALIEVVKGSDAYKPFIRSDIVTSKLNLFEVYYILLRDVDESVAREAVEKYFPFGIEFDLETIKDASKMKLTYKKRSLSMADCIGYCLAGEIGVPFLTGDAQFKDLPNVQFVA